MKNSYFLASVSFPYIIIKFQVKRPQMLIVEEIYEPIADITKILHKKEFYFRITR